MFATNQTKEIGFAQSATQSVPDTQPLDRNCAMARVSNDKRKMYSHAEFSAFPPPSNSRILFETAPG
jgi:hypothetical protein